MTDLIKAWLWRVPMAIGAAVYWAAAAWLCLAVTGLDPLDALSGGGTAARRVGALLVLAVAVVVLALADRAWSRRRSQAGG